MMTDPDDWWFSCCARLEMDATSTGPALMAAVHCWYVWYQQQLPHSGVERSEWLEVCQRAASILWSTRVSLILLPVEPRLQKAQVTVDNLLPPMLEEVLHNVAVAYMWSRVKLLPFCVFITFHRQVASLKFAGNDDHHTAKPPSEDMKPSIYLVPTNSEQENHIPNPCFGFPWQGL